jgi:hypothetical protein
VPSESRCTCLPQHKLKELAEEKDRVWLAGGKSCTVSVKRIRVAEDNGGNSDEGPRPHGRIGKVPSDRRR